MFNWTIECFYIESWTLICRMLLEGSSFTNLNSKVLLDEEGSV